jgi:hypothetical protein
LIFSVVAKKSNPMNQLPGSFFCLLGCVLSAVIVLVFSSVSQAGVYAHYSFDSNYEDQSGFGRHCTLTDVGVLGNSVIVTTAGHSKFGGGSMDFSDDRDFLSLPSSKVFGSGTPYTISFWAQRDSAVRAWDMVIGQANSENYHIAFSGSNTLRWSGAGTSSGRLHDFSITSDTAWHHYAIVADGTSLRFYLDGALVSTATNILTGFRVFTIGAAFTDGDFHFQGRVDEVWILDEAADATMVNGLYVSNNPGVAGPTVDPTVTKLRVVMIAGQSNGDGRAVTTELPTSPVNLQNPQDDVDFIYRVEGGSVTRTTLRPGLTETGQFGPEVTLGYRMARTYEGEPNTRVIILKYANGGTNLHTDWKAGGDATTTGDGPDYVTFQQTINSALSMMTAAYPNATLEHHGVLWVQGESDQGVANTYEANLNAFITDIRVTFGASLPFHIAALSDSRSNAGSAAFNALRAAQANVATADPRASLINTDGYGIKSDFTHYNGAGQQSLGTDAFKEVAYYRWMLDEFTSAEIDSGNGAPDADPDGDGKSNKDEHLGDSEPKDATSQFKAWMSSVAATTVKIHYTSSIYRKYAVEQYQVATGNWIEILLSESGDGGVKSRAVTLGASPQLFRVRADLR